MTDLEFAIAISPQIGDLYAEAKNTRTLAPRNTLLLARSVGAECCDLIAEFNSRVLKNRGTIDSRINELDGLGLIDGATKQLLNSIRRNGNQGVHAEDSRIAAERVPSMAAVALDDCVRLFKKLWALVRPGEEIPVVEISQDDPGLRQQMSHRAAIEGDAAAQHVLWQIMTERANALYASSRAEAIRNNGGVIGGAEYAKAAEHAAFWAKQAADSNYPPAMHQRGIVMAVSDDKAVSDQGVAMLRSAAEMGDRDSISFVGYCLARGQMGYELDYAKARELLEGVGSHPIALAELGRIHLEGLGVARDEAKAFDYTLQSAEAGFAEGQFSAFRMMAGGVGCVKDEEGSLKWLRLAADQGHLRALITLARVLRMKRRAGAPDAASFEQIQELIRAGMPDLNEVKLEMVELLLERGNPGDVVNAGSLLQQCYQIALDEGRGEVASMCVAAAPRVMSELELAILTIEFSPTYPAQVKRTARWVERLFDERGFPRAGKIPPPPSELDPIENEEPFSAEKLSRFLQLMAKKMGSAAAENAPAAKPTRIEKVATVRSQAKTGPNEPCPCGSGVKFKRCHGRR